jgi:Flp pilus assembly pilin Flp
MPDIKQALITLHRDQTGATATEYIVLLVLVACFIIAIVKFYGKTVSSKYDWANQGVDKFVTY